MGLDKFPETFNLQGFFPLAFNRVENFSYRVVYPPADQYSPDDMPEKKREKFLAWHTEKIRENAVCVFHEEVVRYCESDVQLLKEGCLKFIEEFEEIAGFNLLIESVTIASACNLFCRHEKLEEDLIAIKPQNGWRGNRVNQSKVALEWLYFEDWKLGGVSRVRHVRNGGEVKVLTLANGDAEDAGVQPRKRLKKEVHSLILPSFFSGVLNGGVAANTSEAIYDNDL